ncbi:lipoprotein [Nucisporomicrobium flavum]|jgi:Uncharacterised lipoprotein|uniref:lipoprotein n=1 Tax=Nucisporomicrobium flavum TaxID=2785915 RepID=UPI003C2EBF71
MRRIHLSTAAAGLGLVLLTGACGTGDGGAAAPATSTTASAAGNTAEICASGGKAARDVVVGLFSKLGAAAKDGEPSEADLTRIYQDTFGKLGDDLEAHAARATDPGLAAVLREIAAEADKVAAAPDADAGTKGFQAALGKLEQYCPDGEPGAGSSAKPGAVAGGAVGAKGSACELPVTFPVAPKWKPKAVQVDDGDPLAELARKGSLRMVCEIDAKPAGHLGFLRVWSDPKGGDPKAALRSLIKGEKTRTVSYTPFTAGGQDAVEVSYEQYQELLEEHVKRRAFAVRTPAGAIVVELGTLDSEEFEGMLPAYERAKTGLTVS